LSETPPHHALLRRSTASIPVVDPTAYVHPSAVLIGDVIVGPGCYIGPCASLRGDFGRIVIQAPAPTCRTAACCTASRARHRGRVNGHIGHGAVLHGCTVQRDALVGMNAVVMDEAEVGAQAMVAACAFVPAGMPPAAAHAERGCSGQGAAEVSPLAAPPRTGDH
jgi:phenylacetic acid degradation protein